MEQDKSEYSNEFNQAKEKFEILMKEITEKRDQIFKAEVNIIQEILNNKQSRLEQIWEKLKKKLIFQKELNIKLNYLRDEIGKIMASYSKV